MTDREDGGQLEFWSEYVRRLRLAKNWNQAQLAEALETDQTTVSRWERRLMLPRPPMRNKIENLARVAGLLTRSQVAEVVRASPFPMILVARSGMVVASSPSSGFAEGVDVVEQTPPEERPALVRFQAMLEASGFWGPAESRAEYAASVDGGMRSAIATPVMIQGEVFALVQKRG